MERHELENEWFWGNHNLNWADWLKTRGLKETTDKRIVPLSSERSGVNGRR